MTNQSSNERDRLIQKIKSLLALASCQSTTEHERILALKRSQSLMIKYNISISDSSSLDDPELQITEATLHLKPRGILKNDNLFISLVSRIAINFGCYTYRKSSRPSEIIMMGFPTNLIITEYVIESLMNQGWSDYRTRIPDTDKNAGTCLNFWRGFRDGLSIKFSSLRDLSDERGLILYDKIKEAFKSKITGFITSTGGSSSPDGFDQGRESAIASQIRSGITSQKSVGKLLS